MTKEDLEQFLEVKDDNGDKYRNFKLSRKSIENMDEEIISNINAVVGVDDQLWHLGDFAWGKQCHEFYDYRKRINCKDMRLIWGNHDNRYLLKYINDHDPNGYMFQGYYESGVFVETPEGLMSEDEIAEYYEGKNPFKKKQKWYLNHYMNAVWDGSHKGVYHLYGYHLYGHSHAGAEPWREQHMPHACAWDAGVDNNNYKPIRLSDQKAIFDKKSAANKQHAIDHHEAKIKIVRDKSGNH